MKTLSLLGYGGRALHHLCCTHNRNRFTHVKPPINCTSQEMLRMFTQTSSLEDEYLNSPLLVIRVDDDEEDEDVEDDEDDEDVEEDEDEYEDDEEEGSEEDDEDEFEDDEEEEEEEGEDEDEDGEVDEADDEE